MPQLQGAAGYLPDPALTANILRNIAEAQQERIRRMGDIRAQGAGNLGNGISSGIDKYLEGRKYHLTEEQQHQLMAARDKEMAAQDIKNRQAGLDLQGAEETANFMHEAGDGGKTHGQALRESQYQAQLAKPGLEAEQAKQAIAESKQRIAAAGQQAHNTSEDREQTRFAQEVYGILKDPKLSDGDKQLKIQDATAAGKTRGLLPPIQYDSLAGEMGAKVAAERTAAIQGAQVAKQTMPEYGTMKAVTGKATDAATAIGQLESLKNTFEQNQTLGINNGKADAAKASFIGILQGFDPAGAEELKSRSLSLDSSRMQGYIDDLKTRSAAEYATQRGKIPPEYNEDPLVQKADLVIGGAAGSGKPKNAIAVHPGAKNQPAVVGNQGYFNPPAGPAGSAMAQPPAQGTMAPPQLPDLSQFKLNPPVPAQGMPSR